MISKCQIEKMSDHKMEYYSLNTKLCRLVQANPCMYDRTSPNYPKKEYVERAWAHIAKEMNDSVGSCKERWRNIRTAFARSINIYKSPTGPNRHKRYYLHEELEFLTKHITPPTTIVRNLTPVDFEENNSTSLQSVDDSDDNSTLQIVVDTPSPPPAVQLEKERIVISERNSAESPLVKKPKLLDQEDFPNDPNKIDIKDPDSEFLMTLLPEMKEMNARQKISFKTKIFQALREVFDDDKDFPKKIEPMSFAEKKAGVSVTNCSNIPSNSEQSSDAQLLGTSTSNSLLTPMVYFGQGECCVKQELVSIDVDD